MPNETTLFKLIIAENNPPYRAIWEKVFADESDVQIINADFAAFGEMQEVDAVLIPQFFTWERFGVRPQDKVLILDNWKTRSFFPKKLVTSAPKTITKQEFLAQEKPRQIDLEHEGRHLEQVFNTISEFNLKNPSDSIKTLGVYPMAWIGVQDLEFFKKYSEVVKNSFYSCKPALDRSLAD